MAKKIIFLLFVVFIYLSIFAVPYTPFGVYGNLGLISKDYFWIAGVGGYGDLTLNQKLFSLEDLNALLNEGIVDLNNIGQLKLALQADTGIYGLFKLWKLGISSYVSFNTELVFKLPDEVEDFIKNDINISKLYEATNSNFLYAEAFLDLGANIHLGNFFVGPSIYLPVLYVDKKNTVLDFLYTSSASPAKAQLTLKGYVSVYSGILGKNPDIEPLIDKNNLGLALNLGYAGENFGIALRNISIKSPVIDYNATINTYNNFTYTAQGTDITTSATSDTLITDFSKVSTPIFVERVPDITGYLIFGQNFKIGFLGRYRLDGLWNIKSFAMLDMMLLRVYYSLETGNVLPGFIHTVGAMLNMHFVYFDISGIMIVDDILPGPNTTPGYGIKVNFGIGI